MAMAILKRPFVHSARCPSIVVLCYRPLSDQCVAYSHLVTSTAAYAQLSQQLFAATAIATTAITRYSTISILLYTKEEDEGGG